MAYKKGRPICPCDIDGIALSEEMHAALDAACEEIYKRGFLPSGGS